MGIKYQGNCRMCKRHGYLRDLELCHRCNPITYLRQKRITALLWGRWWKGHWDAIKTAIALIY
jgi:hypothetical protein